MGMLRTPLTRDSDVGACGFRNASFGSGRFWPAGRRGSAFDKGDWMIRAEVDEMKGTDALKGME